MKREKICPACKGSGIIIIPGKRHVVKPEKDPWDEFDGRNYHQKVCRRCKGRGVI
jgi:DnaJ-class molecular chaperone